jgi:hypothetical protein
MELMNRQVFACTLMSGTPNREAKNLSGALGQPKRCPETSPPHEMQLFILYFPTHAASIPSLITPPPLPLTIPPLLDPGGTHNASVPHSQFLLSLIQHPAGADDSPDPFSWRPGRRARPRKDPSRPAVRPLQPVLLVAGVSEDGVSRVKLGGGRGRREGCGRPLLPASMGSCCR